MRRTAETSALRSRNSGYAFVRDDDCRRVTLPLSVSVQLKQAAANWKPALRLKLQDAELPQHSPRCPLFDILASDRMGWWQMADLENSKSQRIEIDNGDGYTSIKVVPARSIRELGLAVFAFAIIAALIRSDAFTYSDIVARGWFNITITSIFFSILLLQGLGFFSKFFGQYVSQETLELTDKLLIFRKKGIFSRQERTFDAACIRDLSVVPDEITRPVPGKTYGRNEFHVEFMHAGESFRFCKGLMHAEAKLLATAIANRLAETGIPVSKVVTVEFNAGNLDFSGSEAVPETPADLKRNSAVRAVFQEGIRCIRIKPAFNTVPFLVLVLVALLFAAGVNEYIQGRSVFNDFGELQRHVDFPIYSLMLLFVVFLIVRVFFDAFRLEHVFIDQNVVSHQTRQLVFGSIKRFDRRLISDVRIVSDTGKYLMATDFAGLPAFHVSFDYGEITHHLGCRLRYPDAQKLCEIFSDELNESTVAA